MSSQAVPELMFQNNDHIRGALVVGILRVAKAGWLSGVNNLSVSRLIFLKMMA
jgi:aspartyl/asparaginyl beta-hydroxylase (cupin superfamily)